MEGSDHADRVGEAGDLQEWLTPIPALEELVELSGLRLYLCVFIELACFKKVTP